VAVDWDAWPGLVLEQSGFTAQDLLDWAQEFEQNIHPASVLAYTSEPLGEWDHWWNLQELGLWAEGDWPGFGFEAEEVRT